MFTCPAQEATGGPPVLRYGVRRRALHKQYGFVCCRPRCRVEEELLGRPLAAWLHVASRLVEMWLTLLLAVRLMRRVLKKASTWGRGAASGSVSGGVETAPAVEERCLRAMRTVVRIRHAAAAAAVRRRHSCECECEGKVAAELRWTQTQLWKKDVASWRPRHFMPTCMAGASLGVSAPPRSASPFPSGT
ncbi:hypothetical protein Vafri_17448 [Volvox africanus]|uniref:Uncharacterized protein n=1 Tax=Volvox africanus TaxID=51714 RepID=A0A8J4BQD9_9CHLO|nr:hypothetical protein Vafri_17448 [Volvox africanus]